MAGVRWMIRWFEKAPDDALVGEFELREIRLGELQRIFRVPTDQMYECWPVGLEHLAGLKPYLSVPVELERYDYFIEADALK